MRNVNVFFIFILIVLSSCIKDDFVQDLVEPMLRITAAPDTLALGDNFLFEYQYLNNIGLQETVTAQWTSTNPEILSIDDDGLALANQMGTTTLKVNYETNERSLSDSVSVVVDENTVISAQERNGTVTTTSSYQLSGDFEMYLNDNDLVLEFGEDYVASSALPGLYIYLSNNRNSIAEALEIGPVTVFNGQHNYSLPDVSIEAYNFVVYFCKPFNVKVGDGEIN